MSSLAHDEQGIANYVPDAQLTLTFAIQLDVRVHCTFGEVQAICRVALRTERVLGTSLEAFDEALPLRPLCSDADRLVLSQVDRHFHARNSSIIRNDTSIPASGEMSIL